ncbi:STM3941 family protein [Isoptericola sp. NPDC057191]|uniref:STM3941 family protein n=1 Tax=Isoptericola sp. NPDC057191 TaxID=3346041 RepID=UPI00363F94F2
MPLECARARLRLFPLDSRRTTAVVAGCLAFVAIGVLIFRLALDGEISPVGLAVGPLAVIFFGGGFVALLAVLARRGPAGLRVDASGFDDASGPAAAGRVRWSEVTGWSVREVSGQRFLCVSVWNPEAVIDRRRFMRHLARANQRMVGTPVTIAVNSLKGGEQAILAAFERYRGLSDSEPEDSTA